MMELFIHFEIIYNIITESVALKGIHNKRI